MSASASIKSRARGVILAGLAALAFPPLSGAQDDEGGGQAFGPPHVQKAPDLDPSVARNQRPQVPAAPVKPPLDWEHFSTSPLPATIPGTAKPEEMRRESKLAEPAKSSEQNQIRDIVARVRQGDLSREEGERKLFPLVKKETAGQIDGLDQRIERLKRTLALLEAAKKDADVLVKQRVEELLRKDQTQPAPPVW